MKALKLVTLLALPLALGACGEMAATPQYKGIDRNTPIGHKHLSQLEAGIWVDPTGCDHWIIDDGVEGYLSARLDKYGKPVCSGIAPPNVATGPFKAGEDIPDPVRPGENITYTR
jgi:hypothetical protein